MSIIHEKIIKIMSEVESIAKDRKNTTQNYAFRGVDDVYQTMHDLLAKHGVFTLPEILEDRVEDRVSAKGNTLIYRILKIKYTFMAEDGSNVYCIVIGEGMDSGDKASNKAMSVAHKYAMLQVFMIPTADSKDPEDENHEIMPAQPVTYNNQKPTIQNQAISPAQKKTIQQWIAEGKIKIGDLAKDFGITSESEVSTLTYKQGMDIIIKVQNGGF